eukprot:GHVU01130208.1.p1 GENE.GHVU01130208.1~~GHVU01130208.1.p1  ORF type:complete len:347 (+),score=29.19 GHVU01130208.1:2117-3157(+)
MVTMRSVSLLCLASHLATNLARREYVILAAMKRRNVEKTPKVLAFMELLSASLAFLINRTKVIEDDGYDGRVKDAHTKLDSLLGDDTGDSHSEPNVAKWHFILWSLLRAYRTRSPLETNGDDTVDSYVEHEGVDWHKIQELLEDEEKSSSLWTFFQKEWSLDTSLPPVVSEASPAEVLAYAETAIKAALDTSSEGLLAAETREEYLKIANDIYASPALFVDLLKAMQLRNFEAILKNIAKVRFDPSKWRPLGNGRDKWEAVLSNHEIKRWTSVQPISDDIDDREKSFRYYALLLRTLALEPLSDWVAVKKSLRRAAYIFDLLIAELSSAAPPRPPARQSGAMREYI